MVSQYLSRTLSQINCFNNDISVGGRIRKRYLTTFIPPSTQTPIFKYGGNDDQRSFLSLVSHDHYDSDDGDYDNDDLSFQSLPVDIDEVQSNPDFKRQFILHKRRASAQTIGSTRTMTINKENEDEDEDEDDTRRLASYDSLKPVQYFPESASSPKNNHHQHSRKNSLNGMNNAITSKSRLKISRQNSRNSSISKQSNSYQNYGSVNNVLDHENENANINDIVITEGRLYEEEIEEEEEEDFAHEKVTLGSESKIFMKNTIPLVITFCLSQAYTILCTITASKVFGKNELSAVSLASMTATITFSIFEGISTSLDILCPQAYGSGNITKVGLYTQRSVALSLVIFLPFALLWWYSAFFFRFVLETEELVQLTTSFLRTLIVAGPGYIIFENAKRFLQCQGIFNASTIVLLIATPLSIGLIQVLVEILGFRGIAITCVLNFWIMTLLLLGYISVIDGLDCWDGFKWEAFHGWGELLRFSFAGVVCTFLEASSWEILTLFSSFFGVSALAAQSAISTVASLTFFVPFAVGIASSTRVANFIGAKRISAAKIVMNIGIVSAFIAGIFNASLLYFGRHLIANAYSNDPEVIELIVKVLPLVSMIQIFDALNTVSGSILRGQGMPYIGGVINFIVYDFFAIPLAIVLGYHFNLELIGLWIGIGCGLFLIGVSETYFVLKVDWEDAVQKCEERNRPKI